MLRRFAVARNSPRVGRRQEIPALSSNDTTIDVARLLQFGRLAA
jgi:hypothetical protein